MDIEKVLALISAGFTKDEIMGFTQAPAATEKPQEPEKKEPEPEVRAEENPDPMAALLSEIKGLRSDIAKQNINRDALQISNADKAVEILGSIINPPNKKK